MLFHFTNGEAKFWSRFQCYFNTKIINRVVFKSLNVHLPSKLNLCFILCFLMLYRHTHTHTHTHIYTFFFTLGQQTCYNYFPYHCQCSKILKWVTFYLFLVTLLREGSTSTGKCLQWSLGNCGELIPGSLWISKFLAAQVHHIKWCSVNICI